MRVASLKVLVSEDSTVQRVILCQPVLVPKVKRTSKTNSQRSSNPTEEAIAVASNKRTIMVVVSNNPTTIVSSVKTNLRFT